MLCDAMAYIVESTELSETHVSLPAACRPCIETQLACRMEDPADLESQGKSDEAVQLEADARREAEAGHSAWELTQLPAVGQHEEDANTPQQRADHLRQQQSSKQVVHTLFHYLCGVLNGVASG